MTTRWPDITVFCNHGIAGSKGEFVQRYRHVGDRWVATNDPRQQMLRGDEPFSFEQPDGAVIRERAELRCKACSRNVVRRDEVLQEQLYSVASAGLDTLQLHDMQ